MNAHPVSVVDYIPAQHLAHGSDGPGLLMLAVSNLELEEPYQLSLSWPLTMPRKEPQVDGQSLISLKLHEPQNRDRALKILQRPNDLNEYRYKVSLVGQEGLCQS